MLDGDSRSIPDCTLLSKYCYNSSVLSAARVSEGEREGAVDERLYNISRLSCVIAVGQLSVFARSEPPSSLRFVVRERSR